jgi:hypothetical protein
MWFLFVRPEVCRQLPSDSASRRTPLLLAMCLALSTRTRDFHPLDCAHAGRTKPALQTYEFGGLVTLEHGEVPAKFTFFLFGGYLLEFYSKGESLRLAVFLEHNLFVHEETQEVRQEPSNNNSPTNTQKPLYWCE